MRAEKMKERKPRTLKTNGSTQNYIPNYRELYYQGKKKSVARGFCLLLSPLSQFSKILPSSPQNEPLPTGSSFSPPDSPEPSHFIYFHGEDSKSFQLGPALLSCGPAPSQSPHKGCDCVTSTGVCSSCKSKQTTPCILLQIFKSTSKCNLQNQDALKQFHCRLEACSLSPFPHEPYRRKLKFVQNYACCSVGALTLLFCLCSLGCIYLEVLVIMKLKRSHRLFLAFAVRGQQVC